MSASAWHCDVDPVVVELAVGGYGVAPPLNHCERIEAVSRLRADGLSLSLIAARLNIPKRAVERYVATLKEVA